MFEEYTRWDKTHQKSIHVEYQCFESEIVRYDRAYFDLTVVTCNPMLAHVFGVETDDRNDSRLRETIDNAIRVGDHVFYLEFGEHSAYWAHLCDGRPARDWDSGFAGVIVVHREAWLKAMPGKTFARSYVSRVLHKAFGERLTAELNGWVYEAHIDDPDDPDACYSMGDFLDPEEALKAAMLERPDICYKDDDFDEEVTYSLKAA